MRAVITAAALLLSGCALTPETRIEEAAYQGMHAVDWDQSATRDYNRLYERGGPHYVFESSNFSDGGWLVGPRPTPLAMSGFMAAEGLEHLGVTWLLQRYTDQWCVRAWEAVTFSVATGNVVNNYQLGLSVKL